MPIAGWNFTVEPDNPPQIALVGEPRAEASGALALAYSLDDDYGVVAARGEIAPLADPATGDARPLYDAPALPLSLPQLRVRDGTGQTIRDLTSHPWAGAKVKLTLVATDEAKQEGKQRAGRIHPAGPPLLQSARPRRGRAARPPGARRQRRRPRRRRARRAHRGARQDRRHTATIWRCAPPISAWSTPAATTICGAWSTISGRSRSASRTATCRSPPRRCATPRRRCARRWRTTPPTRRSRSSPRTCARRMQPVPAGARRRGARRTRRPTTCRPMPTSRRCARRTCSACSTRSRTWRAPAPATPPARCSPNCRTCWRTCRPAGRSRAASRTTRRCRASTSSAT